MLAKKKDSSQKKLRMAEVLSETQSASQFYD
jgi:hypothetical protein